MPRFAPVKDCDVLFVAGEASGDEHAGVLVRGLMERNEKFNNKKLNIAALGGRQLHEAGATMLDDLTAHSAVGLWEVLKRLGKFLELIDETVKWIEDNKPKLVVFVDFPGFNLHVAKKLFEKKISHKAGGAVKLFFYVSPQIWAWKGHRRFTMARQLDSLGVIFPFEVDYYKDTKLPTEFVGHPFAQDDFKNPMSYDPAGPILLLPGSRKAIVKAHLPVLWQAYRQYAAERDLSAKVAGVYANEAMRKLMIEMTDGQLPLYPAGAPIKASAALCTAGTVSLLTALARIPAAILYKTDALTYFFGRRIYKLKYLGMPNLLLKRLLMKEFWQEAATAENLSGEIHRLKNDPSAVAVAQIDAAELKNILGHPSQRTAVEWIESGLK